MNYGGVGFHVERIVALHPEKLRFFGKFLVVGPLLYSFAVLFSQFGILSIYLQFFTERAYRHSCHAMGLFIIASFLGFVIPTLVQCRPLQFAWDKSIRDGTCPVNFSKLTLYAGLPNLVTDIVMLLLPLPYIYRLPTDRRTKISLAANLGLGSL